MHTNFLDTYLQETHPPPMSAYNKTRLQQQGAEELYKTTTARIQKIQSQLANAPRGTKLKDKVCIITGVGSLKGIGYVCHVTRDSINSNDVLLGVPQLSVSPMKVCNRNCYFPSISNLKQAQNTST